MKTLLDMYEQHDNAYIEKRFKNNNCTLIIIKKIMAMPSAMKKS